MNQLSPVFLLSQIPQLWLRCANFELYLVDPVVETLTPPMIISPAELEPGEFEFVYPIHDYGQKLMTSRAQDMYNGLSMCRLYYTIEKMIFMLIERIKQGGASSEDEVQIAFGGHLNAQRKAFESVINLTYNVVVINFDPGVWGERYLENIKQIAQKGYGYPSESPRTIYRQHPNIKKATLSSKY